MSDENRPAAGSIAWCDLTVGDADTIRDFYAAVVGWKSKPHDMGGYADYEMQRPGAGDSSVAGICWARGVNADIPPQWMIYVVVADVEAAVRTCKERGGHAVTPIKGDETSGRACVIQDPAGAVLTLYQVGKG
ncbi:MAG: VOC family protein [Candidatus Eisenbacteria bacterium]